MLPVFLFLGISFLPNSSAAKQGNDRIHIRDYRKLVSLSSVQISPDGSQIVLIRSIPDYATDSRQTDLVLVDAKTGAIHALTDGKGSVSSPRWSPSGDRLAFISSGAEKQDEVFVSNVTPWEPKQVTHAPAGVQQFSWSPKGNLIAYVTPDSLPNSDAAFDIGDDGYRTDAAMVPSHLWVVGSDGSDPKRITHGSWSILETAGPFAGGASDPSWSPDGTSIAFARQANAHNSDSDLSTVAVVDLGTGKIANITGGNSYEYQPIYSPLVTEVAYLHPQGLTPLSVMDVFTASAQSPLARDHPYIQMVALDRDITSFAWSPDGKSFIVSANERTGVKIWRQTLEGSVSAYPLDDLAPSEFTVAKDGTLAFLASTATTPPELYTYGPRGLRSLTNFNAALKARWYATVSEFNWSASDGERSDGVLTYPRTTKPGPHPLVVWIHGGPEAAALRQYLGFEGDLLRQSLASDGYLVLEPNYRGSDNLGNRHEHAIYRDPALGPADDVLSGIQALVAKGLADPRHITVAGHSYGGFMTSWLITQDHRWRSAVVADGVTDWAHEYCFSNSGNLAWTRDSLGGGPWDKASEGIYRRFSPINSVDKVTTPTLVITGTADEQVPVTCSYMLYHALKDRHIPVRFVGIPLAHHTPDSPRKYEQFYEVMEQWIEQHDPVKK